MGARLGRVQAVLREGGVMFGVITITGSVSITLQQRGNLLGFGEAEGVENAFFKTNDLIRIHSDLEMAALESETVSCDRRIELVVKLNEQMRNEGLPVFIAGWDGQNFSFRLSGTHIVPVPKDVADQTIFTGESVTWTSERGYTYLTSPDPKSPISEPVTTVTLSNPKGKGDNGFGLSYPIIKLGFGSSLWAAIEEALGRPESEVTLIL